MDRRKTAKADLEKERMTYFLYGLVVILAVFFVVLEWKSEEYLSDDWEGFSSIYVEEELIGFEEVRKKTEGTGIQQDKKDIATPDEPISTSTQDFEIVDKPVLSIEIQVPDSSLAFNPEIEKELSPLMSEEEMQEIIHARSEIMPEYPGGYEALVRFIFHNMKYPSAASKQKIEGRVWCSFVVNKDGSVSEIKIEKGIYAFLDDEALRVLRLMPPWTPGRIDNQPVRVKVYLPVVFKL